MNIREKWNKYAFVNLYWIIGVLVSIIILLLSVDLGTNNNVKDIINFAVSVSSLVLAVFAIAQAFISGSALPDAVSAVRNAINEIKEPAERIQETAILLSNHTKNIDDTTRTLSADIAQLVINNSSPDSSASKKSGIKISYEDLQSYPIVVNGALYIIKKSFDSKKSYTSFLLQKDSPRASMNILGVITTFSTLNIVGIDHFETNRAIITDLGELKIINDHIDEILDSAKKLDEIYPGFINSIDSYFIQ